MRPRLASGAALLAGLICCAATDGSPAAIPLGAGQQSADVEGGPLRVFTYKPGGCVISSVLLVFHGVDRNAGSYRDDAISLGQRSCMLVLAPLFDAARFPGWRYQRGGVVHHGVVQPASSWTVAFVPRLVAWARAREGRPDLSYALIGHSAGAQFLSRVAAYGASDAASIVVANPSTWVQANLGVPAPYGFANIGGPAQGEAALRRYLARPITVLLGRDDTGSRNLSRNDEAEQQGATRYERGQTVFEEAKLAARQRGWPFGWRLAVVPGVGHNARKMFASDAAFAALRPDAAGAPAGNSAAQPQAQAAPYADPARNGSTAASTSSGASSAR